MTLEVTTAQEGDVEVELSYRTRAARWRPLYEARLSENHAKLDLALYAAITQNTGEKWDNVRLEISNARPSRNLTVPAYTHGQSVDWIKQHPVYASEALSPPPMPAPVMAENTYKTTQSMAPKDALGDAPVQPEEAVEASASVIEEASGLAATFRVDGAKDVPSDNEPHRFKVMAKELEPTLNLFTTPRLDPTAYLLARFASPSGMPLFPGSPVTRFAGNQRLGEAPLVIPAAGQSFALGFGPYKGVRVTFRRVDQKLEQVGAFSKDRQWTLRSRIELANDGNEPLEIEVQDHILKPANDQVKIILLPDFTPGWLEPIPGVRSWKLKLGPKEQKQLELPITIRAPREGIVTGLDEAIPSDE